MYFTYLYPDWEPYPTTYLDNTWPEKVHHPVHLPMPVFRHHVAKIFHDKDHELHSPKADVRETPSNFYVDVELPGLKEKSLLSILWRSTRTLLVSTNIERPAILEDIVTEGSNGSVQVLRMEEYNVTDGNESSTEEAFTKSSTTHGSGKKQPHLTVGERQIGTVVRAFNFPVDVNHEKTTAKLDAGLLRLVVPKEVNEKIVHKAVDISEG